MAFQRDEKVGAEFERVFGEYLTTFISEPLGEVRADVFRNGKRVEAHVSFSTGVLASNVNERYVSPLWDYARQEGVADSFHLILS